MPFKDIEQKRAYQLQWVLNRKMSWIESQGGRCVQCGSAERLEVDHIDPSTKVSHRIWNWSDARRLEELAKCQVLCYDCHKAKTRVDLTKPLIHGTSNAFNRKGCRCDECKLWDSEDEKAYRLRVKEKKLARKVSENGLLGSPGKTCVPEMA